MRKTYLGAMVTAASLLGACVTVAPPTVVQDEESLRIEESMRPDTEPPPEGIELGLDAPPLAPPDYDTLWAPVGALAERMPEVGTNSPHYYSGPYAFPMLMPTPSCGHHQMAPQYNIEQRHLGSTPGLLP